VQKHTKNECQMASGYLADIMRIYGIK
jgi:hypothetical protein